MLKKPAQTFECLGFTLMEHSLLYTDADLEQMLVKQ